MTPDEFESKLRAHTLGAIQAYADVYADRKTALDQYNKCAAERDAAIDTRDAALTLRDATVTLLDAALVERDAAIAARDDFAVPTGSKDAAPTTAHGDATPITPAEQLIVSRRYRFCPNQVYQHYKNVRYVAAEIVYMHDTRKEYVLYGSLEPKTVILQRSIRPVEDFFQDVVWEGKIVERFALWNGGSK